MRKFGFFLLFPGKSGAVCIVILGVFAIASLIAALVINTQAVNFLRGRLLYRMNTYVSTDDSIDIIDKIQSGYQCCGVNLWLDWSLAGLGQTATTGGTGGGTTTGTGTGTGTVTGTGSGTGGTVVTGKCIIKIK